MLLILTKGEMVRAETLRCAQSDRKNTTTIEVKVFRFAQYDLPGYDIRAEVLRYAQSDSTEMPCC